MDEKKRTCKLFLLRVLALLGAALSVLALYEHVSILGGGGATAFCSISSTINCEGAIRSPWSSFWGVPLGSYGLLFYLVVFALALAAKETSFLASAAIGAVLQLFAFAAALGSIGLFAVLKFAVGTYCPICLTIYVVNFLLLAISSNLSGESTWRQSLWSGFKNLIGFFTFLLGLKTGDGLAHVTLARLAFLAFVCAAGLCFILPEYWSLRLVQRAMDEGASTAGDLKALAEWKSTKPVQIDPPVLQGLLADHIKGPEQAPIQVLEFSDFECPACRAMWFILEGLIAEYGDQVRLVFRHYPLDSECNPQIKGPFHKNACFAAEFARCAEEQGRFWDVAGYLAASPLFDQKEDRTKVREGILQAADYLKLDKEAMVECLSSRRQLQKIKIDMLQAEKLGVSATPAVWINGRPLRVLSAGALRLIFDRILGK